MNVRLRIPQSEVLDTGEAKVDIVESRKENSRSLFGLACVL